MTKLIQPLMIVSALALLAGPAAATDLCTDVTEWKPIEEAQAAAVKAGYIEISKMDKEDGCYEAKGLNSDGTRFDVYIHPTTLEIVKVKTEG